MFIFIFIPHSLTFICKNLTISSLLSDGSFFIHHITITKALIPHYFGLLFIIFVLLRIHTLKGAKLTPS